MKRFLVNHPPETPDSSENLNEEVLTSPFLNKSMSSEVKDRIVKRFTSTVNEMLLEKKSRMVDSGTKIKTKTVNSKFPAEFVTEIKNLNCQFSNFISMWISKDPCVDFSPVIGDYINHLSVLKTKHNIPDQIEPSFNNCQIKGKSEICEFKNPFATTHQSQNKPTIASTLPSSMVSSEDVSSKSIGIPSLASLKNSESKPEASATSMCSSSEYVDPISYNGKSDLHNKIISEKTTVPASIDLGKSSSKITSSTEPLFSHLFPSKPSLTPDTISQQSFVNPFQTPLSISTTSEKPKENFIGIPSKLNTLPVSSPFPVAPFPKFSLISSPNFELNSFNKSEKIEEPSQLSPCLTFKAPELPEPTELENQNEEECDENEGVQELINLAEEPDAFYRTRIKLLFKRSNTWIELGVGLLNLKKVTEDSDKVQILVRVENSKAARVLMNIIITKSKTPVSKNGKAIILVSVPNPAIETITNVPGDSSFSPTCYLLRIKTQEDTDTLYTHLS